MSRPSISIPPAGWLDAAARRLPESMYARVWSVGALPGSNGVLVVWVTVAPIRPDAGGGGRGPAVAPDGVRLVTLLRAQ